MKFNVVETIGKLAASLADAEGIRSGANVVVEQLVPRLSAQIAFVALKLGDSVVADIVAAKGVGAADFRRLETRLSKSSVWKILHLSSPLVIDDLAGDAVLNFLAFGTSARMLI